MPGHAVSLAGTALAECQEVLGHAFRDPALLALALTHASARPTGLPSNERLEFLGDAVLGCVVSDWLYGRIADAPEGRLTRLRAQVVSARGLARAGRDAGLARFLVLGRGIKADAPLPPSLLANVVEAVVGAAYLDGGLGAARGVIERLLADELASALDGDEHQNWKAMLQHVAQTAHRTAPKYRVVREEGPAHGRRFEIVAIVGDREFAPGHGWTKKAAEQIAARHAFEALADTRADASP